jgi:addiction module RelE/StbE family toxin
MYKLRLYPGVKKQLRNLREVNERVARLVEEALADLKSDPYPPTAEELRDNYAGIWKIKVDGWRIFYEVNDQDRIVVIISVKRRTRDTYLHIS